MLICLLPLEPVTAVPATKERNRQNIKSHKKHKKHHKSKKHKKRKHWKKRRKMQITSISSAPIISPSQPLNTESSSIKNSENVGFFTKNQEKIVGAAALGLAGYLGYQHLDKWNELSNKKGISTSSSPGFLNNHGMTTVLGTGATIIGGVMLKNWYSNQEHDITVQLLNSQEKSFIIKREIAEKSKILKEMMKKEKEKTTFVINDSELLFEYNNLNDFAKDAKHLEHLDVSLDLLKDSANLHLPLLYESLKNVPNLFFLRIVSCSKHEHVDMSEFPAMSKLQGLVINKCELQNLATLLKERLIN